MKFSIGDKIKLRKTGDEGVVIDIIQDQYLRVRVNGVVIPAEEEDLDFPYLDWFLQDRAQKKEQERKRLKGQNVFIDNIKKDRSEQSAESQFAEGVYLLMQPVYREQEEEDVIHRFVVYLFSEWPKTIDYVLDVSIKGKSIFAFEGSLSFQQKQLLYSFPFEDATDNPLFDFEIQERDGVATYNHFFKIKLARKKLIEKVRWLQEENIPLFELPVFTELKEEKIALPIIGQARTGKIGTGISKTKRKAKAQIDLHIEKLYKEHERLSDAEKLQYQLDYFNTYLDLALADERINPLRVIHGIGAGTLKKEIFSILQQTIGVHYYVYEKVNPGVSLVYFNN